MTREVLLVGIIQLSNQAGLPFDESHNIINLIAISPSVPQAVIHLEADLHGHLS